MSSLVALIGVFPSAAQARKQGWNKPITSGEFWFQKRQKHLIVK